MAVIHIDGNGLGQIVAKIGGDPKKFKQFSEKLDKATKAAAKKAFSDTIGPARTRRSSDPGDSSDP